MIDQFIQDNRIRQILGLLGNAAQGSVAPKPPPIMMNASNQVPSGLGNPVGRLELTPPNSGASSPDQLIGAFNRLQPYPESAGLVSERPRINTVPFQQGGNSPEFDYQPQTDMNDRFRRMLDEYPQRQSGQGILRKISAVGLGTLADAFGRGGGQEAFSNVMYPGYDKKLADWKSKITPTQQAADNERADNTQRRMFAQSVRSGEQADRRLDETERRNRETADLARIREERVAKHERARIEIARYLADNPTMTKEVDKDGFLHLINPRTGERFKTDLDTGQMSDLEKANMGLKNALTRIKAQGEVTKDVQATAEADRQKNRESLLRQRTEEWNLLPAQKRQLILHNAEQLIRSNPALEAFITFDPNTGMPEVAEESEATAPGRFFGKGSPAFDKKTRDAVIKALNEGLDTPRRNTVTNTEIPKGTKVGEADARNQAIELLKSQKKPITEANIAYVMKQLGAK